MNAFDASRKVEARGNAVLLPYLEEKADGRLVLTNKGTLARWLQESVGDALMQVGEKVIAVELKCEQKHTGNVFLEIWSNRNLNSRDSHAARGSTAGWLWKTRADLLLYYFLDEDLLYSIDLFCLKRWLFGCKNGSGEEIVGAMHRVGLQAPVIARSEQLNDTYGLIVSINRLRNELTPGALKQTHVRQREIEMAA